MEALAQLVDMLSVNGIPSYEEIYLVELLNYWIDEGVPMLASQWQHYQHHQSKDIQPIPSLLFVLQSIEHKLLYQKEVRDVLDKWCGMVGVHDHLDAALQLVGVDPKQALYARSEKEEKQESVRELSSIHCHHVNLYEWLDVKQKEQAKQAYKLQKQQLATLDELAKNFGGHQAAISSRGRLQHVLDSVEKTMSRKQKYPPAAGKSKDSARERYGLPKKNVTGASISLDRAAREDKVKLEAREIA